MEYGIAKGKMETQCPAGKQETTEKLHHDIQEMMSGHGKLNAPKQAFTSGEKTGGQAGKDGASEKHLPKVFIGDSEMPKGHAAPGDAQKKMTLTTADGNQTKK